VIALNRAVAVSFATGVEDGLRELVPLEARSDRTDRFHRRGPSSCLAPDEPTRRWPSPSVQLALAANPPNGSSWTSGIEELRAR